MSEMKAAKWIDTDTISVQTVPVPKVPEGWALVEVCFNGLCGSDLGIYHGKHPRAQHGLIPGHEISGRIVEPGTTGLSKGALVIAEPLISCGECGACRSGNTHVCNDLKLYGIDVPGGMAQYVALPGEVLYEMPESVGAKTAALVEPLAVAVHAVSLSGIAEGDTIAVVGGGPIGILTALVAREAGAKEVILSEPNAWRRKIARSYGFTVVEPPQTTVEAALGITQGEGVDVFFDTAGHPAVAAEYTASTRVRGRIVVVGVHKVSALVDLQGVCFKEQTICGVRVYTSEDIRAAIELLVSGKLSLDDFPTKIYPLEQVTEAFEAAAGAVDCLKVLIDPKGVSSE